MITPITPTAISTSPRLTQLRTSRPVGRAMPSFIMTGVSVTAQRLEDAAGRLGDHGVALIVVRLGSRR